MDAKAQKNLAILKTVRLVPFASDHIQHIAQWAEVSENAEFFRRYPPLQDWLNPQIISQLWSSSWVICEDDSPVGLLTMHSLDLFARSVEIGLLINRGSTKQAHQTAQLTINQACDYAFHYKNLHKVYVKILEGREKLKARLEKVGFTCEALLRDSIFFKGEYKNEYLMSCLKLEFKEYFRSQYE